MVGGIVIVIGQNPVLLRHSEMGRRRRVELQSGSRVLHVQRFGGGPASLGVLTLAIVIVIVVANGRLLLFSGVSCAARVRALKFIVLYMQIICLFAENSTFVRYVCTARPSVDEPLVPCRNGSSR